LILASAVSSPCDATRLHGKSGFDETFKILLDTDLKSIILLEIQTDARISKFFAAFCSTHNFLVYNLT